jgi:competence protein ComEA
MERSVMPWRALDAAEPSDPARPTDAVGAATPWRTWPILASLASAAGLAAVAIALVATGPEPIAVVTSDTAPVSAADPVAGMVSPDTGPVAEVVVHVAGAVARPGLVRLPAGSRVADAIDAAGGLGPRVDVGRLGREINLAAIVSDAERLYIPSRDDAPAALERPTEPGGGSSGGGSSGGGLVDLNRATASELEALPGIGEVTAGKIIAAREERPFQTLEELLERKVLGRATLEKIRALVVIR